MTTWDYVLAFATITPLVVWAGFRIGREPSLLLLPALWLVAVVCGIGWGALWGVFWGFLVGSVSPVAGLIIGACGALLGFEAGFKRVWDQIG